MNTFMDTITRQKGTHFCACKYTHTHTHTSPPPCDLTPLCQHLWMTSPRAQKTMWWRLATQLQPVVQRIGGNIENQAGTEVTFHAKIGHKSSLSVRIIYVSGTRCSRFFAHAEAVFRSRQKRHHWSNMWHEWCVEFFWAGLGSILRYL